MSLFFLVGYALCVALGVLGLGINVAVLVWNLRDRSRR